MAGGPIAVDGEIVEEETARRYFADIITGVDYCKFGILFFFSIFGNELGKLGIFISFGKDREEV